MEDLTPREQQVLDLLKSGGGRCSLDDMLSAINATKMSEPTVTDDDGNEEERKVVRRQGIIQSIKSMNSKLALVGQLVVLDEGGRGRGNKAIYALKELKRRRRT